MRRLIIISTLLLLTIKISLGQSADPMIKGIRAKYTYIHKNLNSYDTTMTQIWNESTEGGQATAYYDDKELKMIQAIWFGETGKKMIEYYFDQGQLIFAFNQDFFYNRPIYWDQKLSKEHGDNEAFDPKKTTVKEDRYYFNNEELFLWLGNTKTETDLTLGANSIVGLRLIADVHKRKEQLKK
jgi:hypothetical protein